MQQMANKTGFQFHNLHLTSKPELKELPHQHVAHIS
ncbi:hypothetical protein SLEP1_g7781 [Rubroshorea leprosula]|uniref:Uncharacterized protein n=1 Tax=Rubroshorea leprosula TaxID=152421 RepID=A0AAV5I591_9ROSI|nr:hypothetical protein SLEP1_g7781 [Rubroshorea leprosula]